VTASELAFMALGLLLGAATGAALITFVGTRLPRREIRVTVTRDALPRRSETLSQDAFVTSPAEPARGGPGDRRSIDRSIADRRPAAPLMTPGAGLSVALSEAVGDGSGERQDRTIVPTGPGKPVVRPAASPGSAPLFPPATREPAMPTPRGPIIEPRPSRHDRPRPQVTTTVPIGSAVAIAIEEDAERELEQARHRRAWSTPLERILRGEHRAMAEVLDTLAGTDGLRRREWEMLLGNLVDSMDEMAVREAVIDFPMGTAFWDTFTVEQCRRVIAALASMGYRYDGHDGWVENRVPAYRDLSQALADVGLEPRRIRAWPNAAQIADLLVGARPAPEELLAAAGPDYAADDMRELLIERADELADLWLAWEAVKPVLLGGPPSIGHAWSSADSAADTRPDTAGERS